MEEAAISYQSPSIIATGASAQSVSLLATLVNICLSLICVKAPALIERIGLAKRGAIILAFSSILTWVPLAIAFLLSQLGITPVWIAVLWMVNIMPGMLLSFQRDNWLSNIVPGHTLGRYFGQRLAIKSGFYLASFFLLGYLMDSIGEKNLASFGFVCLIAFVMTFVDFVIFTYMHEPAVKGVNATKAEPPKIKFGIFDFIRDLKQKKLDKFILFTSFINVSIGLGGPFYAVYMLQEQKFTYLYFTVVISVEFLARVVSGPFWGRFADKAGSIKVLTIVSRIVPALPICWLFSTNIGYLVFLQILSGICWGAFDLSTQSYLYKVAPPPRKLRYIVYTRSLMLFSVAVGGILGAFLVKDIFPTFGSRLLSVFMISGFFRAIVVMFLMPKLIDLAVSYGRPKETKFKLELVKKVVASRRGLFYQPPEPAAIPAQAQVVHKSVSALSGNMQHVHRRNLLPEERLAKTQMTKRRLVELTGAVRKGGRRKWAVNEIHAWERKEAVLTAEIKSSRRPWYGDSEILAAYKSRMPAVAGSGMKMNPRKADSREGLFYNDTGWACYMRETLQEIMREKEERKAVANLKPVFVENRRPVVPVASHNHGRLLAIHEFRLQKQAVVA